MPFAALRAFLLFAVALLAALPGMVSAREVKALRFAHHGGYTRVVLETDQKLDYTVGNYSDRHQAVIVEIKNLSGRAPAVELPTGESLIREATSTLSSRDQSYRLHLRTVGAVIVRDYILASPDRIVLDVYRSPFGGGSPTANNAAATPAPPAPSAPAAAATTPAPPPAPAAAAPRPADTRPLSTNWRRTIVIDPGHGGYHKGGVGRIEGRPVYEKDVTIAVAERIERHFRNDPRFDLKLTRRQDVYVGLFERTQIASRLKGDLFISLHCNAVEGRDARARARGFEIWTWNPKSNRSAAAAAIERLENEDPGVTRQNNSLLTVMMQDALESQALESQIVARAVHSVARRDPYLRHHDRGIDSARFKVLEIYDMPSILVEMGFMTHPEEVKMLFDPGFQERWARIIYEGVIQYYEQTDPSFPRLSITTARR